MQPGFGFWVGSRIWLMSTRQPCVENTSWLVLAAMYCGRCFARIRSTFCPVALMLLRPAGASKYAVVPWATQFQAAGAAKSVEISARLSLAGDVLQSGKVWMPLAS